MLVGAFACSEDRVAKSVARSELAEESTGEGTGSFVVDGPAGGDNATHAHFDQLARKAVGQQVDKYDDVYFHLY